MTRTFGQMECGDQTAKMVKALDDWIQSRHVSTHYDATEWDLNLQALICENVAREFLKAAKNLRHSAIEAGANDLREARIRQADFGTMIPVGFVKQKSEVGLNGTFDVWRRKDGSEIQLYRSTSGKVKPGKTKKNKKLIKAKKVAK